MRSALVALEANEGAGLILIDVGTGHPSVQTLVLADVHSVFVEHLARNQYRAESTPASSDAPVAACLTSRSSPRARNDPPIPDEPREDSDGDLSLPHAPLRDPDELAPQAGPPSSDACQEKSGQHGSICG